MRHKARDSGGKFALLFLLCRRIGLLFGKTGHGFTRPHVIGFVDDLLFFPLWRADLKMSGFAAEFAGCVWTVAVSGNKKLHIQKYPDASKHHIIHLDK